MWGQVLDYQGEDFGREKAGLFRRRGGAFFTHASSIGNGDLEGNGYDSSREGVFIL